MSDEWTKRIGLADMYGTCADVTFMPPDENEDGTMLLILECGGARTISHPTPEAARQLAAALLDGADAMEANG